jgi:hypothetical protein
MMNLYLTVVVLEKQFRLLLKWPGVTLHSCRLDEGVEEQAPQNEQRLPAYAAGDIQGQALKE